MRSLFFLAGSLAVGAFLAGCTGVDPILPPDQPVDAGPGAEIEEGGFDASDLPCDPAKDFGSPVPVSGLANASSARFSPDERVVYFDRYVTGNGGSSLRNDIYTASRPTTSVGFDAPRIMTELGGEGDDSSPTVTADRKGIFFVRNGWQVWKATGKISPFVAAEEMPGPINGRIVTRYPYVLPDGSAIYVVKDVTGTDGGSRHIYRAGRGDGSFSDVKQVLGLGDDSDAAAPVVTADELTIYWSSRRGSVPTIDVFVATRKASDMPFSGVRRVAAVNTTARDEAPTFISADGCRLYYSSTLWARAPASGFTSDILVATRPK